jgi:hypothetical protein
MSASFNFQDQGYAVGHVFHSNSIQHRRTDHVLYSELWQ